MAERIVVDPLLAGRTGYSAMAYEVNDTVNWTALSAEAMKEQQRLDKEEGIESAFSSGTSVTAGFTMKLAILGVLFLVMAIIMLYCGMGIMLGVPGVGLAVCAYWLVFGR